MNQIATALSKLVVASFLFCGIVGAQKTTDRKPQELGFAASLGKTSAQYSEQNVTMARQWDVIDIRFRTKIQPPNPVDVEFSGLFEHELDERIEVPGFFDGNGQFVLRFTRYFI